MGAPPMPEMWRSYRATTSGKWLVDREFGLLSASDTLPLCLGKSRLRCTFFPAKGESGLVRMGPSVA